jgi:hypothetical protein
VNERLGLIALSDVESALIDLGTAIELPPTPDLAAAVGARLRERSSSIPARRPAWRSFRRGLLFAAVISILVVGAALGFRIGLDLLSIDFGPVPSVRPTDTANVTATTDATLPAGANLGLGDAQSLEDARARVPFPVLVPAVLGLPDAAYVGGPELRGQLALVYRAGDDLPASTLLDGAGLLVTQNHGRPDDRLGRKLVSAGLAKVETAVIDGAPGYWISGEPHVFWYLAPDGSVIEESRRLVGDTLVWERDDILYRIEGAVSLVRALEIAESMR